MSDKKKPPPSILDSLIGKNIKVVTIPAGDASASDFARDIISLLGRSLTIKPTASGIEPKVFQITAILDDRTCNSVEAIKVQVTEKYYDCWALATSLLYRWVITIHAENYTSIRVETQPGDVEWKTLFQREVYSVDSDDIIKTLCEMLLKFTTWLEIKKLNN